MKINPINRIHLGDCRNVMRELIAQGVMVDSIVTDPPYELGFMGKKWDKTGVPFDPETWSLALALLKPGGHMLAFGGTRTYHRMVCAIEDGGFDIRDQLAWMYGTGFPKSLNVGKEIDKRAGAQREVVGHDRMKKMASPQGQPGSGYALKQPQIMHPRTNAKTDEAKQWDGWGTALKPAWEPIVLARKPLEGTVASNVLQYGTGAINIDGCRIATEDELCGGSGGLLSHVRDSKPYPRRDGEASANRRYAENGGTNFGMKPGPRGGDPSGRWPANVIHDGSDEVLEMFAGYGADKGASAPVTKRNSHKTQSVFSGFSGQQECGETFYADQGTAARFFQCCPWTDDELIARFFYSGKVSSAERNDSTHPTIKPLSLMRYLVRLITPPQGVVLDLFAGTGPTGEAALQEGADYILIEKDAESIKDINRRMHGAQMGFPLTRAGKGFA